MTAKYKYLLTLLLICASFYTQAQESMMAKVDNVLLQRMIDTAKVRYPRMRKYEHKINEQHYAVNKAKWGWFEGLTFAYTYNASSSTTTPNTSSNLVGYTPGIFINFGNMLSRPATVRMAREELKIAQDEKEEFNLALEAQIKDRYYKYVEAMAILNLKAKSANDADVSQTQIRYKYEQGIETFDNYSKVLVLYSVSSQNKIEAESAVLRAKSALEEIVGAKLEEFN